MDTSSEADKHANTKIWINHWCRRFKPDDVDWENASDPDEECNCMGYATGKNRWFQNHNRLDGVDLTPTYYWPPVPEGDSIDHFVEAAKFLGFKICDDPLPESDYDKITLYYSNTEGKPFWHAAITISAECWKSKIAGHSDIEHPRFAFDDISLWGNGRVYMKREKKIIAASETTESVS